MAWPLWRPSFVPVAGHNDITAKTVNAAARIGFHACISERTPLPFSAASVPPSIWLSDDASIYILYLSHLARGQRHCTERFDDGETRNRIEFSTIHVVSIGQCCVCVCVCIIIVQSSFCRQTCRVKGTTVSMGVLKISRKKIV